MDGSRPTGTVTFLFTDLESSTRQWEDDPEVMAAAVARHEVLLRDAIERHGGYLFGHRGDGVGAAFPGGAGRRRGSGGRSARDSGGRVAGSGGPRVPHGHPRSATVGPTEVLNRELTRLEPVSG